MDVREVGNHLNDVSVNDGVCCKLDIAERLAVVRDCEDADVRLRTARKRLHITGIGSIGGCGHEIGVGGNEARIRPRCIFRGLIHVDLVQRVKFYHLAFATTSPPSGIASDKGIVVDGFGCSVTVIEARSLYS